LLRAIDTSRIHKLDYRILLLIAIIQPILTIALNYLYTLGFYKPIYAWSGYLINPTLQGNLIMLLVMGYIIFKIGKHDFASIWLNGVKLKNGLLLGMVFWLVIQASALLYLLFSGDSISIQQNINKEIGAFFGQLFGNALIEELIFRGIFFLQFYIILRKRFSDLTAFLIAVIISQFFFSVVHLPNRLFIKHYKNVSLDLIKVFIMGTFFVIFYIRTQNFALSVFVHSLFNHPLLLFKANISSDLIVFVLFLMTLIFWDKIKIKFG